MEREPRLTDTTLDTFWDENSPNRRRCEDLQGDKGTIVGYHDRIVFDIDIPCKSTQPWFWVIRDRDNALVGIHESQLK